MNILITNDDGWDAPGLAVLKSVAQQFGNVWSVAPLNPMSGISHQITFERPLTLVSTDHQSFSLDGTPADCVRIATTQLSVPFDWVLSGINNGGNLGSDVFVSGTIAAAREATSRGIRSIALSQHRCRFKLPYDWTRTSWMAELILKRLLHATDLAKPFTLINVNFPDKYHSRQQGLETNGQPILVELPLVSQEEFLGSFEIVKCPIDRQPIPAEFRIDEEGRYLYCGKYHERERTPGGDIENCFGGAITVSELRI
jgi:5'-nucleotidase